MHHVCPPPAVMPAQDEVTFKQAPVEELCLMSVEMAIVREWCVYGERLSAHVDYLEEKKNSFLSR